MAALFTLQLFAGVHKGIVEADYFLSLWTTVS